MEIKSFKATEAKTLFGQLLDTAIGEPVSIERNGRPVAVLLSLKEYRRLTDLDAKTAIEEMETRILRDYSELRAGKAETMEALQLTDPHELIFKLQQYGIPRPRVSDETALEMIRGIAPIPKRKTR